MVGRNKPETVTTESEDNTELLAREECARLTRQLRLMENDKKAYLEESNATIFQQKKMLDALDIENTQIQKDLDSSISKYVEEREEADLRKIRDMLTSFQSLDKSVKQQSQLKVEMMKKMSSADSKVSKMQQKVHKNELGQLTMSELDKKDFVLKKKLETVTSQFDAVVADNGELRQSIDEILQENVSIMLKCSQLEQMCLRGKTTIDDLVDQATTAYDQREEAVGKANALFERNAKEKKQYVLEMSELSRTMRHEEKLLDFMSTKNKERYFLETDDERISRLEQAKEQTLDEALESYRDNFGKLLTKDSPNLASLVSELSDLQHANISRFNYINELNNEIEAMQTEVATLRDEIRLCSLETVERNQVKNAYIMLKQEQLDDMRNHHRTVQLQATALKSSMDLIVKVLEKLFRITECSGSVPVLELLGTNQQQICCQNALLYLNILEHRLVQVFALRMDKDAILGMTSERGTPAFRSPRHQSKPPSETSMGVRPRMVVTGPADSEDFPNSDDELQYDLVDEQEAPLAYATMREKVLVVGTTKDASGSSISGEGPLPSPSPTNPVSST